MKLQIYRLDTSSYFKQEHALAEKEALESIGNVDYIQNLADLNPQEPFALISNTKTNLDNIPEILKRRCSLVIHPNSGFDNFTKEQILENDFPIILGNSIRKNAVSEYVLSAIFQSESMIKPHVHWQSERSWGRKLLKDKKVLIIGGGHIGSQLSQVLNIFNSNVTIFDPYLHQDKVINISSKLSSQELDGVEILIIACSLSSSSKHIINKDNLSYLAKDSLIINPARGEVINIEDLKEHCKKFPMTKVYLDVFEEEPFPPGYLQENLNIIKTSHVAGVSKNLNSDIIEFEKQVVSDFVYYLQKSEIHQFYKKYDKTTLKPEYFK